MPLYDPEREQREAVRRLALREVKERIVAAAVDPRAEAGYLYYYDRANGALLLERPEREAELATYFRPPAFALERLGTLDEIRADLEANEAK